LDGKPCAACTEDIELEKEINELEIKIEKIHSRRRALRTAMNENHDPLIHRFPPEIVSHIFIQYSPPNTCIDNSDGNSPLYLGAVCQKWRQLAWATPGLWTSLRIDPGEEYGLSMGDLPQLASEWLERSASLPLTITLEDDWSWLCRDDKVINILNKHSARWHDMRFNLPARHLHHLSGSSEGNILRRLVLRHSLSERNPADLSTFSMKSKPSPTDLTLISVGLPYVDIIWNNLTVASVNDIGVGDCFELIRRAPLLETLRLEYINPSSDVFPIPNTRIVHPHLHSLELRNIHGIIVVTGILDSLCLPSLEQWIHNQSPFPLDNMKSFIRCSSFRLKIFKINIDRVNYLQRIPFLSHLSSLEFLELRAGSFINDDRLFPLLCASAQSPLYLPHLQSLEFVCGYHFPWDHLPEMFTSASRWRSLKVRVRVNNGYRHFLRTYCQEHTARLLLKLVDQGINFSVVDDYNIDLLQAYQEDFLNTRS
jgi:hypothetical protein